MNKDTNLLTVKEFAEMYRISASTVYRAIKQGDIPYFRMRVKGSIRFDKEVVQSWINQQYKKEV